MSFFIFIISVIGISLVGSVVPGPMAVAAIWRGHKSPHAGALLGLGHAMVELPMMLAVFYGLSFIKKLVAAKFHLGLIGGLVLFSAIAVIIKKIKNHDVSPAKNNRSTLIVGAFLTAVNPYFYVWWITIGVAQILHAVRFGMLGSIAFAIAHWMGDFLWYYLLSVLSFKGWRLPGKGRDVLQVLKREKGITNR